MAEKKKRRGRRAYLNDFQATASGEYVYNGKLHSFEPGRLGRKQALAVLWGLTAVIAAAAAAAGCVDAAGMQDCWYVIAPWAASMVCAVSVVWLMCRLTAGGDPLRDYIYQATVKQAKVRGWFTLILAAAAVAGELVFLLGSGVGEQQAGTAVFLTCIGLEIAGAAGWLAVFQRLKWAK